MLEHHLCSGVLSTLSVKDINALPIIPILSSRSLETLDLEKCNIALSREAESSLAAGQGPLFHLKRLTAIFVSGLTLVTVLCCQELEYLHLGEMNLAETTLQPEQWPLPAVFPHLSILKLNLRSNADDWLTLFRLSLAQGKAALPSLEELYFEDSFTWSHTNSIGLPFSDHVQKLQCLSINDDSTDYISHSTGDQLRVYLPKYFQHCPSSLKTLCIERKTRYLDDSLIGPLCDAMQTISSGPNALTNLIIYHGVSLLNNANNRGAPCSVRQRYRDLDRMLTGGRQPPQDSSSSAVDVKQHIAFPALKRVFIYVVVRKMVRWEVYNGRIKFPMWEHGELDSLKKCSDIELKCKAYAAHGTWHSNQFFH
ncbi:hypothetical protein BJ165DRAFT_1451749 [Panaeolus papilionaceus]|nr:hypothetical protein BJ165DRAFT_1451749 [Panaeolus papilionaceus]